MGNHADRVARVQENDARLEHITRLNRELEGVGGRLEEAWGQLRPLIAYYEGEWSSDLDALDDHPDGQYGVLSEDGVWNEMTTFISTVEHLHKQTARLLAEFEAVGQEPIPADSN